MKNNFIKNILPVTAMYILCPVLIQAQELNISSGGYFVASGSVSLVIENAGFKNDGTFTSGTGTVMFTGNAATANSFIGGASLTAFNNVTVNKIANGVQLNADISIANILDMQSGDSLFLNNHIIDLGSTASITGETGTKRITGLGGGYIQVTATLNAPVAVNPGNLGIEITSGANLGLTVIKRSYLNSTGRFINRFFNITPTTNTGLNASLKFYYFDQELNGISEAGLLMYSSNNGGVNWVQNGFTGNDVTANFVTMNLFDQLQLVTLSDVNATLAVLNRSFTAHLLNQQILLDWQGNYDANSNDYEVERSGNGKDFNSIGTVKQLPGNVTAYSFIDEHPLAGINYYRLKQSTKDGHLIYSTVVLVKNTLAGAATFITYPNPAQGQAKTILIAAVEKDVKLALFDNNGKPVLSKKIHLVKGRNEVTWDVSHLPSGTYFIQFADWDLKSEKFIKL